MCPLCEVLGWQGINRGPLSWNEEIQRKRHKLQEGMQLQLFTVYPWHAAHIWYGWKGIDGVFQKQKSTVEANHTRGALV
ncbi:hypothetical protein P3S68_028569 [Capsicum galapagoense]